MQEARLKRELQKLKLNPSSGISCSFKEDNYRQLTACILGPKNSPYDKGIFNLEITVPDRYPFEPPLIKFTTLVYHPNIDNAGRICMDSLKMPPNGSWAPTIGIENLLVAIQQLMAYPNPDDPLMADIAEEYKNNKELFEEKAKKWTLMHAVHDKNLEEKSSMVSNS